MTWKLWLQRVRHDLVKRLVWPARDLRDLGGTLVPGELCAKLVDDEGRPATAKDVWANLKDVAPDPSHPALAAFEPAFLDSVAAARRDDLVGVLALESAFDELAQHLASKES